MKKRNITSLALLIAPAMHGAIVFNDSFDDGGFTDGADATDTAWHGTTGNSAIEIFGGDLSLRSGTSGRGLHAVFAPQTISTIGDKITATFTFTTPATVNVGSANFRVGLFDSNGATIHLQDGNSSTDAAWNTVIGNAFDYDTNINGTQNFQFREKPTGLTTGRLLGTTTGLVSQGSGGEAPPNQYSFAPNTSYTGTYSIEMTGASEWDIRASLTDGVFNDFEVRTRTTQVTDTFDILAFHVNSNTFGSTNGSGDADNGIDFQNVTLEAEIAPLIPEPSSALLSLLGGMIVLRIRLRHFFC